MSSSKSSQGSEPIALPPPEASDFPDEATSKNPAFDKGGGPGQVFHFERFGISYGTDDKGHAAALILSVLLLLLILVLFIVGVFSEGDWISDALKILGPAFTFVAGVAVGKSSRGKD